VTTSAPLARIPVPRDPPPTDRRPTHVRRLRLTAAALRRFLDEPGRLPDAWRTTAFSARVDRVRAQLLPIRSLAALATSFSREHDTRDPVVRLAYGLRWLELTGIVEERPWRLHCAPGR
jgi:hypothetical protein